MRTDLDMIDRATCSFAIPAFSSDADRVTWMRNLTEDQGWELFRLMQVARFGPAAVNAPMDRSVVETFTMGEFRARKDAELAAEEGWRRANGWPPVIRTTPSRTC